MDKEKFEIYKANMLKMKKERENNTGVVSPFREIESNIETVTGNIKQFLEIANNKHVVHRNKKEYIVSCVEVLNRDMLKDILEKSDIYNAPVNSLENKKISKKQFLQKISNINARVNLSLKKHKMFIQAISHDKNQYRIVIDNKNVLPKNMWE